MFDHLWNRNCYLRQGRIDLMNLMNWPTTVTWPMRVLATAVLIWHMYPPLSDSWMLLICKFHLWCWSWDTLIRGLRVITRFWTVRIPERSKWIHATCIIQTTIRWIPYFSWLWTLICHDIWVKGTWRVMIGNIMFQRNSMKIPKAMFKIPPELNTLLFT